MTDALQFALERGGIERVAKRDLEALHADRLDHEVGSTGAHQVRIVRGPVARLDVPGLRRVETVSFTEPGRSAVTVVRGGLEPQLVAGLFRAAGP